MKSTYDVIVIGLGAMGSATTYQLAKRGARVLGLDRFAPPHDQGSSHGETRITRRAVGEGEAYVPLVQRAYELWAEIEAETGHELLKLTGGYIIAPSENGAQFHGRQNFVAYTAALADKHHINHNVCSAAEIRQNMPMLQISDNEHAYYEPTHGLLFPERCIEAQLQLAQRFGATLHLNEPVLDYTFNAQGVTVTTKNEVYQAEKVVVSAGAWLANFLPERLRRYVAVYRQVIFWFDADDLSLFQADCFPWLIWIGASLDDYVAIFPMIETGTPGVKVLTEQYHQTTAPDAIERTVQPSEIEAVYDRFIDGRVRGIRRTCLKAAVCSYTVTPDEGFLIDFHPDSQRVIIASPCSGHGFKHSAAIGEVLAQLALTGRSTIDIAPFSFSRFEASVE